MGKLNIVWGDILDNIDDKDLIVNSTNKYMAYGSGVCGAIYRGAGRRLLEYCQSNFREDMKVNEIRITPGFDLNIDILHIFCPKFYESKDPIRELLESYDKIVETAKGCGYKSIVSVSLGTGVHGYKHEDVALGVVNKLKELVNSYDIDFTLVLPNKEIMKLYI